MQARSVAALSCLSLALALPSGARQLLAPPRGPQQELQFTTPTVVAPQLVYCGGKVLSQAQLVAVLWGPAQATVPPSASCSGAFKDCLAQWYTAFVQSPQFGWLDEYQTTINADDGSPGTGQHIGPPTFYGVVQIAPHNTKAIVSEAEVEAEIVQQIADHVLPAPDSADETIYEVHFPLTVDPSESGNSACSDFCAYHDSWVARSLGTNGILAILPSHMPPGYSGGRDCSSCGEKSDWFANLGGSISHETIEAITDPFVGQAGNSCSAPLGWYDSNNADALSPHGEIGDMCEGISGFHGQVTEVTLTDADGSAYTVQREWSNKYASCLTGVDDAFTLTAPATPILVAPGSQTAVTLTTSAPVGGSSTLPVSLAAHGLPALSSATFDPAIIHAGESTTMTVALATGATETSFSFGITAESGTSQAQAVAAVSAPDFSASATPTSLSLTAGGAPATVLLDTTLLSGDPRSFTVKTSVAGVTATPATGPLGSPLSLSLAAIAGAASMNGALSLLVTSAGVLRTVALQLKLTGDDASLAVPAMLSVAQGGSAQFTVSSATTSGSPQPLQLSTNGLPTGATVTFSPATITSGQSAQATLSVPATQLLVPFSFFVVGKGPAASVTARATSAVTPPAAGGCASPGPSLFALAGLAAMLLRKRRAARLGAPEERV